MRWGRFRGRLAPLVAALGLGVAGLAVTTPAAMADSFDDACSSPTTTIPASSSAPLSVGAADVVLISGGTFSGGIDAWAAGGVVCVAAAAAFSPPYINNANGSLYNRGTVTMPSTAVSGSFIFDNFGTASFPSGFNTNGFASLINRPGATWTMAATFNDSAQFQNEGTATFSGGLNQNTGGTITNTGTLTIGGQSNLNDVIANRGVITFAGTTNMNSGSRLLNDCRVQFAGGATNGGSISNNGHIDFGTGTWQNNAPYTQSAGGVTTGTDMRNDNAVTGFGSYRFTGNTVTQATFS